MSSAVGPSFKPLQSSLNAISYGSLHIAKIRWLLAPAQYPPL